MPASTTATVDAALAQSLSGKSDQELIGILANPADWRPEVVEFARAELEHRSTSGAQVDEKVAEITEGRKLRSDVPLSSQQCILPFVLGFVFGFLGFLFVWRRASRFEKEGYTLKAQKTWHLCWLGIGVRLALALTLALLFRVVG